MQVSAGGLDRVAFGPLFRASRRLPRSPGKREETSDRNTENITTMGAAVSGWENVMEGSWPCTEDSPVGRVCEDLGSEYLTANRERGGGHA